MNVGIDAPPAPEPRPAVYIPPRSAAGSPAPPNRDAVPPPKPLAPPVRKGTAPVSAASADPPAVGPNSAAVPPPSPAAAVSAAAVPAPAPSRPAPAAPAPSAAAVPPRAAARAGLAAPAVRAVAAAAAATARAVLCFAPQLLPLTVPVSLRDSWPTAPAARSYRPRSWGQSSADPSDRPSPAGEGIAPSAAFAVRLAGRFHHADQVVAETATPVASPCLGHPLRQTPTCPVFAAASSPHWSHLIRCRNLSRLAPVRRRYHIEARLTFRTTIAPLLAVRSYQPPNKPYAAVPAPSRLDRPFVAGPYVVEDC